MDDFVHGQLGAAGEGVLAATGPRRRDWPGFVPIGSRTDAAAARTVQVATTA